MDRCAVFVDAGWLLSEAAQAICGRGHRSAVECDYARLTQTLCQLTEQATQLPLALLPKFLDDLLAFDALRRKAEATAS